MMTVFEYAEDVNKSVEEIIKLCEKLNISKTNEEDLLDQDEITMLDNEIANSTTSEDTKEVEDNNELLDNSNDSEIS